MGSICSCHPLSASSASLWTTVERIHLWNTFRFLVDWVLVQEGTALHSNICTHQKLQMGRVFTWDDSFLYCCWCSSMNDTPRECTWCSRSVCFSSSCASTASLGAREKGQFQHGAQRVFIVTQILLEPRTSLASHLGIDKERMLVTGVLTGQEALLRLLIFHGTHGRRCIVRMGSARDCWRRR